MFCYIEKGINGYKGDELNSASERVNNIKSLDQSNHNSAHRYFMGTDDDETVSARTFQAK